jgi:hypothetical protein
MYYTEFLTLMVCYACKWIQPRDSVQESLEGGNINNIPMVGSLPLECVGLQNTCAGQTLHGL